MPEQHNRPIVADSLAIARIHNEWVMQIPDDLYIPPAAFQILLDYFEGPLDFLLYLVHKNGLNLLTLDIAPIASQYLSYIQGMQALNIELAADYMVMAASLADIKSRLLLPKPVITKPEDDPRQDLLARLQNYAKIKQGAGHLNHCTILERDVFPATIGFNTIQPDHVEIFDVDLLLSAMTLLLNRPKLQQHEVKFETVQLEDRILLIEQLLNQGQRLPFDRLIDPAQGTMGIVVTFIAVLELIRQCKLKIIASGFTEPLMVEGDFSHAA